MMEISLKRLANTLNPIFKPSFEIKARVKSSRPSKGLGFIQLLNGIPRPVKISSYIMQLKWECYSREWKTTCIPYWSVLVECKWGPGNDQTTPKKEQETGIASLVIMGIIV